MPKEYTIQCSHCGSCIHIQIQPVNALIHLSCLKCHRVIFSNVSNTPNLAPTGPTPIDLPRIQPSNIAVANRYHVRKPFEEDNFSRTFLANDIVSKQKVLLRVFKRDDEKARKRLQELIKLRHKNLHSHLDTGIHNDRYFVVYDFEEGDTLQNFLKHRRIIPRHVVTIILEIAHAVKYLHENDYIGAEILTKNIYITKNRDVKLYKFSDDIFANIAYQGNAIISSGIAEMSLERIRHSKKGRTPESDVYTLGAVLYETLTGTKSFSECGRTLDKLFYAKLRNNYKRIGECNPYISHKITGIVEAAMHHNPQQRLTIEDMISQLQAAKKLEEQFNQLQNLDENIVKYFFQERIEDILCTVETSMGDILEEDLNNQKVNDRYLLKRQMGKNCFLVFDEQQHQLATMKVIKDITQISLLDNVAQIASKARDDVVQWYHCEQKSNFILLLQKYMRGENLQISLQKKAIFRPHKALEICLEILNILEHLHENQIACGELTISDIFIDIDNQNKVCLVNAYLHHIKNNIVEQRPIDELIALDIAFVGSVLEKLLNSPQQVSKIIDPPTRQTIQNIIAEMKDAKSDVKQIKEKLPLDMIYHIFCENCGWHSKIQQGKNWTCHECNMHLHIHQQQPEVKYLCESSIKPNCEVYDENGYAYTAYSLPENVDKEKLKTLCFHQPLGVTRYLDFWQKNGKTYVVCEPQIGTPLPEALHEISASQIFILIEKICLVLEKLHKLHLVHNNLNPTNILVEGHEILLTDVWLYPEQTTDNNYCDPANNNNVASDIYSLGRILKFIFDQTKFRNYQRSLMPLINDVISQDQKRFGTVRKFLDEFQEIRQQFL